MTLTIKRSTCDIDTPLAANQRVYVSPPTWTALHLTPTQAMRRVIGWRLVPACRALDAGYTVEVDLWIWRLLRLTAYLEGRER